MEMKKEIEILKGGLKICLDYIIENCPDEYLDLNMEWFESAGFDSQVREELRTRENAQYF